MSEGKEQALIFKWASEKGVEDGRYKMLYAVPNGLKTPNARIAARAVAEGLKKGFPDMCLDVPVGGYHGLRIELKVGKNKTSKFQDKWIERLRSFGYRVEVCYGSDAAMKVIDDYLQ